MDQTPLEIDLLIVGGGIAGLWAHAVLIKNGYRSLLINDGPLGMGQSIASQGMIHGGQRYTLSGMWSSQADSISQMPEIWNKCLSNAITAELREGLNLTETQLLSTSQFLWSEGGFLSKATSFFASKAMQTRTKALSKQDLPEFLASDLAFSKATVFEMPEKVVDCRSLLINLSKLVPSNTLLKGKFVSFENNIAVIERASNKQPVSLVVKHVLFTAGTSNENAFKYLNLNFKDYTQRRPLKQVMVKNLDAPFYGHAITTDPRPRATITAHPIKSDLGENAGYVWYLGGLISNFATEHTEQEGLRNAYDELRKLFPSIDWKSKKFKLHAIDRAEPKVKIGFMPEGPELDLQQKIWVGWPTKMTFAPLFAKKVLEAVERSTLMVRAPLLDVQWSTKDSPTVAEYPWNLGESESSFSWKNPEEFL